MKRFCKKNAIPCQMCIGSPLEGVDVGNEEGVGLGLRVGKGVIVTLRVLLDEELVGGVPPEYSTAAREMCRRSS